MGTQRQLEVIRRVAERKQLPGDKDRLMDIYWTMTDASICGLGQTAASAVLSALKLWPELFEEPVVRQTVKEAPMPDQITLTINGIEVAVPAGTTILKAAEQVGVTDIPTLCYHEACTSNGLCRICVVEVEGSRTLTPSCCTAVTNGMKIQTRTPAGGTRAPYHPGNAGRVGGSLGCT